MIRTAFPSAPDTFSGENERQFRAQIERAIQELAGSPVAGSGIVVSPTFGAGNNNDYALGKDVVLLRVATNASGSTLTGLLPSTARARSLRIVNLGTTGNLTITHQDTNSAVANRIITPDALSWVLPPTDAVDLVYDDVTLRWRLVQVHVSTHSLGEGARVLFDHYADVSNSGTGETDLYSDSIGAGRLAANGEKLVAQYSVVLSGALTSTQQVKMYFGGTAIFDTGGLAVGAATTDYIFLLVTIMRKSSSAVIAAVSATSNVGLLSAPALVTDVTGLTLANAQILKITGTAAGAGGASNQITAKEGYVQWHPAAG